MPYSTRSHIKHNFRKDDMKNLGNTLGRLRTKVENRRSKLSVLLSRVEYFFSNQLWVLRFLTLIFNYQVKKKKIKNFKFVYPNAKSKLRPLSNVHKLWTSPIPSSTVRGCNRWRCRAQIITKYTIPSSSSPPRPPGPSSDRRRVLGAARPCVYPPRHRRWRRRPRRPTQTTFIFVPVHPTRTAADRSPLPLPPNARTHRATVAYYSRSTTLYIRTYVPVVRTHTYIQSGVKENAANFQNLPPRTGDRVVTSSRDFPFEVLAGQIGGQTDGRVGRSQHPIDFVRCGDW